MLKTNIKETFLKLKKKKKNNTRFDLKKHTVYLRILTQNDQQMQ